VDLRPAVVADEQPLEVVEPGERALDHPAGATKPGAVLGLAESARGSQSSRSAGVHGRLTRRRARSSYGAIRRSAFSRAARNQAPRERFLPSSPPVAEAAEEKHDQDDDENPGPDRHRTFPPSLRGFRRACHAARPLYPPRTLIAQGLDEHLPRAKAPLRARSRNLLRCDLRSGGPLSARSALQTMSARTARSAGSSVRLKSSSLDACPTKRSSLRLSLTR